jgi:hypothetical protein
MQNKKQSGLPAPTRDTIPVNIDDGNRTICAGYYHPSTRTFTKPLKHTQLLKFPPAIATQLDAIRWLEQREQQDGPITLIVAVEGDTTYSAPLATVKEKGFSVDRGYGRQVGLMLKYWSKPENHEQLNLL